VNPYLREFIEASKPEPVRPTRRPVVWRAMTDIERTACTALARVSFPPGTGAKRLARSLTAQAAQPAPEITDAQASALWSIVHRFRRQIPAEVVRSALESART